jgi:alpha-beta hydrolase superfamily lysophospholipase
MRHLTPLGTVVPRLISAALILLALLTTSWLTRGYLARDLPPLRPWHFPRLDAEFRARDFADGITYGDYQAIEGRLVEQIKVRISDQLQPHERTASNRYDPTSPAHPDVWSQNWNLSFELPHPNPTGAVVLLHGASDSPYSLRALAQRFAAAGLHVIVPRLPGNGTLPGELINVRSEDWTAITNMAVGRARALAGGRPIFIGGYSTGAALALQYSLRAVRDQTQPVDGLFLFSPAIGISGFAALARWDVLLSRIPFFQKFAWMNIWPEYDPFKYASFPKQAGHLVHKISESNKALVEQLKGTPGWSDFPPTITFQSIVDETVNVEAVLNFHANLDPGGHQLILFDVNRSSTVAPFLEDDGQAILERLAQGLLNANDVTVVANRETGSNRVVASRRCNPVTRCLAEQHLEQDWPANVYSLSHIALPFPPQDPLYGANNPDPAPNDYNLGQLAPKGERSVLVIPAEDLNRLRYNPFFDYMATRAIAFCPVCSGAEP